jgi:hypothetical protein
MSKTRVFVDTNVILEAIRTKCWSAICNRFSIETVEKCIEESLTGHTPVQQDILLNGLTARHSTSKREIANLFLSYPECQGLDDGELHLLAWLYAQRILPNELIAISTADKAAIRATAALGWIDALISLEQLVKQSGVTSAQLSGLRQHYKIQWLAGIKSDIRLGMI